MRKLDNQLSMAVTITFYHSAGSLYVEVIAILGIQEQDKDALMCTTVTPAG